MTNIDITTTNDLIEECEKFVDTIGEIQVKLQELREKMKDVNRLNYLKGALEVIDEYDNLKQRVKYSLCNKIQGDQ